MAIWQYTLIVIPNAEIIENLAGSQINQQSYYEYDFWSDSNYKIVQFDYFEKVLSKSKSWSKNIILFGKEDSNCLEVFVEGKKISEVTVRLDFRKDYSKILDAVIEFVSFNSFILLDEELKILPINSLSIKYLIVNSKQYKKYMELIKGE